MLFSFRYGLCYFLFGRYFFPHGFAFSKGFKVMLDFNLPDLLGDTLEKAFFRSCRPDTELFWHVDSHVPLWIGGFPGILSQFLMNLVAYSLESSPAGEVEVRVFPEMRRNNQVALTFSVRDTGEHLSSETLERLSLFQKKIRIFPPNPYISEELEILVMQELLATLQGTLRGENLLPRGRKFSFTLPFELPEEGEKNCFPVEADLEKLHVLVVEPNASFRGFLREILESWGMRSAESADGMEALRMLYMNLTEGDPFHLGIIDASMPDMDGNLLGQTIREDPRFSDFSMVLLSRKRCEEAPGNFLAVLPKPLRCEKLREILVLRGGTAKGKFFPGASESDFSRKGGAEKGTSRGEVPSFEGKLILVAEDMQVNREVVSRMLKKTGARINFAENGEEAVRSVENQVPDLVLMDLHMPRMDGFEATRILRKKYGDLPIIALSAAAMEEDLRRTRDMGMQEHLVKPISRQILYEALRRYLSSESSGETEPFETQEGVPSENLPEDLPGFQFSKGLALFDGSMGAYQKALERFLEELSRQYGDVPNLLKAGEIKIVKEKLHTLKGVAGTLGALEIREKAEAVEKDLQTLEYVKSEVLREFQEALNRAWESRKFLPFRKNEPLSVEEPEGRQALRVLREKLEKSEFVEEEVLQRVLGFLSKKTEKSDLAALEDCIRSFETEKALELANRLFPERTETEE